MASTGPLVADALNHGRAVLQLDATADLEHSLLETLFDRHEESRGTDYPNRRFRKRLELVMADQDLQWAYWESHVRRRRGGMIEALRAAIDSGELRPDLDVDAALDTLLGVFCGGPRLQPQRSGVAAPVPRSLRGHVPRNGGVSSPFLWA